MLRQPRRPLSKCGTATAERVAAAVVLLLAADSLKSAAGFSWLSQGGVLMCSPSKSRFEDALEEEAQRCAIEARERDGHDAALRKEGDGRLLSS